MALINCPECSKEISDKAVACPQCGCPINNQQNSPLTQILPSMLWDSEDETYIWVKCPRCDKESKIKKTTACKTSTGYSLSGDGKCSCGLTFDTISQDISKNFGTCSDCGATLYNNRGFCSKCGAIQISKSDKYISTSKPTGTKSGGRFKYFLWICGVLLLMGMCSVQNNTSSKSNPTSTSSNTSKPDYESDLEERCKDWIYNRNRAYKLGREGDQKGSEQARRAMNQFYNDLKLHFSEKQISAEIAKLEAAGYKAGF